jgi:site-specific DNA recombinase
MTYLDKKAKMKICLYARVSSEEQKEGQTIDSQIAELERFAKQRAWRVVDVYRDEGRSGAIMARPELDRLRDDATKGLFEVVLINDVDRLARDVAHLGVIKRDLERKKIRLIFRKLPSDESPTNNLMVNILGSFAEFERELILDRTRRGRRYKVEVRKKFLGSIAPYGFRYIPKDASADSQGRLEIEPNEADVVREMYRWVAEEGLSGRKVVKRLNQLKIQPRKKARKWAKSSVMRILRSEVYRGIWYYNKYESCEPQRARAYPFDYATLAKTSLRQRSKQEWIPLQLPLSLRMVESRLWRQVQQQLDRNITFSPRNEKHQYLLKGLVHCGGCGAAYVGDPSRGRFFYRCSQRCKKFPTIVEDTLNNTVWEAVKEIIARPSIVVNQIKKQMAEVEKKLGAHKTEKEQIEKRLEELSREESRILDVYREGVITAAQLGAQLEKIESQRNQLDHERATSSSERAPSFGQVRSSINHSCELVKKTILTLKFREKQQLLRILLKEIVFEGNQVRISGRIPHYDRRQEDSKETDPSSCRIASMAVNSRGRNPASKDALSLGGNLPESQGFPSAFKIVRRVDRPPRIIPPRDPLGRFTQRAT